MDFFKEGLGQFAKYIQSVLMYFTNFGMRKKDFDNSEDFCKVYGAVSHLYIKVPFKTWSF